VRDEVANLKILKLRDNVIRACTVCRKQEFVDPTSGAPAAAMPARLNQPGPHGCYGCLDGDCVSDHELRPRHEVITRHTHPSLVGGRAVSPPEPMNGRVRNQQPKQAPRSSCRLLSKVDLIGDAAWWRPGLVSRLLAPRLIGADAATSQLSEPSALSPPWRRRPHRRSVVGR